MENKPLEGGMEFLDLREYLIYMISRPFFNLRPVHGGITEYGRTLGLILHREGFYQTELFIVPAGVQIVEFHTHPNVDSYEMGLAGDFTLESNGVKYPNAPLADLRIIDRSIADVPSTHVHGGEAEGGGSFLSFQRWKNGVMPTSVTKDFKLDLSNANHSRGLKGLDDSSLEKYKQKISDYDKTIATGRQD